MGVFTTDSATRQRSLVPAAALAFLLQLPFFLFLSLNTESLEIDSAAQVTMAS